MVEYGGNDKHNPPALSDDFSELRRRELQRVRESILPYVLWVLSIFSVPATVTDVYKLIIYKSEPVLVFHVLAFVTLWITTFNHKRLGYRFCTGYLTIISYALSLVGIYSFGLISASTYGFFGASIMAAIFYGPRLAAGMTILCTVTIAAFGIAAHYGYINYETNYSSFLGQIGPWLATATTFLLYAGIAIVGFVRLINTIGDSLKRQQLQTAELQKLNEELRREIVERERAVRMHSENEEKLRVITSSALDAVIMLDAKGRVVMWNPAAERIFGYSAEEILGREVHSLLAPPQYYESIRRGFEEFTRTGRGAAVGKILELTARHRDGHEFPVEMAVSGIFMQSAYWSTAIIRNIEERKRAEEEKNHLQQQLQQAAKMEAVGRLAGGVAHDFNNLLTSISGNVALLLMDEKEPRVSCSGLLNEIRKAAESASQLTRQLLSFSRRQIIEPRIIDVNRHIMHMQKMLMRLIGEDVALDMVFSENPGTVKIDRGQFEQILMNLVVNARDALPYGGRISVVTERVAVDRKRIPQDSLALPGTYIVLRVADTGLGMSEEVRKHIFEPFFTTKLDGMGTGLGLATIYGAVHQAGGFIEVRSEPGRGSEFSIFLPEAHGEVESFCRSENNGELMTGNETILLVEDETMVRELAERLLTRWGYKVLQAADGKEALELFRNFKGRIDLLMTDVIMPGMNGKQLAEKLTSTMPELKVLFSSGYNEDVIAHKGVIEEGLHFIGKPYTPAALSQKIRKVLDGD